MKLLAIFAIAATVAGRIEARLDGSPTSLAGNVVQDARPSAAKLGNESEMTRRKLWELWRFGGLYSGGKSYNNENHGKEDEEDSSTASEHSQNGSNEGEYEEYWDDTRDDVKGEDENQNSGRSGFGIMENAQMRWLLSLLAVVSTILMFTCCVCISIMLKKPESARDVERNSKKVPLHIETDETTVDSAYFTRYDLEDTEVEAVIVPAKNIEKQKQPNFFSRTLKRIRAFKPRFWRVRSSKPEA